MFKVYQGIIIFPKRFRMNFVRDFDSQSVCHTDRMDVLLHVRDDAHKEKCGESVFYRKTEGDRHAVYVCIQ